MALEQTRVDGIRHAAAFDEKITGFDNRVLIIDQTGQNPGKSGTNRGRSSFIKGFMSYQMPDVPAF